ncbi:hypothetical protein ACEQ8H_008802 [Pleosporales sp. CAS-2024a]
MAEILGAVAAGTALCGGIFNTSKFLYETSKRLKNASQDILDLADEAVVFADLCDDFFHTCEDDPEAKGAIVSIRHLVEWLKLPYSALEELLNNVKAIVRNPKYRGFSSLIIIRKLNVELQILKHALNDETSRRQIEAKLKMRLEEKIKWLEQQLESKESVHQVKMRSLVKARDDENTFQQSKKGEDFGLAMRHLAGFTDSLNTFAKDVLPRHRSSRHSASSRTSFYTYDAMPDRAVGEKVANTSVPDMSSRASVNKPDEEPSTASMPSSATGSETPINIHHQKARTVGFVEHRHIGSREYMNDPEDNILSSPKIKINIHDRPALKTRQIGRHTIWLSDTQFGIDDYTYRANIYEDADQFFNSLSEHADKVEELVQVLDAGDSSVERWNGIPGWLVDRRCIEMQCGFEHARDVH